MEREKLMLVRGDPFGKVGFGCPFYKGGYLFWRWWTWLVMNGLEPGDVFLNNWEVAGEVMIPVSHNALVRAFLETDCDTLLMVEDDHEHDDQVVRRMREKTRNWDFDVVCASYTTRRGQPLVIGCDLTGEHSEYGYRVRRCMDEVALSGTQQYDVAALGLVLIRRWVLEAMLADRDPERFQWFSIDGANSQDIPFYARAKGLGARVGIDRDEWIGHIGQKVWTKADFVNWREGITIPQWAFMELLGEQDPEEWLKEVAGRSHELNELNEGKSE